MSSKKKPKSTDNPNLRKLLRSNYGGKEKRLRHRLLSHLRFEKPRYWWKGRRWWQKIALIFVSVLIAWLGISYGVARWYIARHANEPLTYGVTYIPNYARYLDLNPKETLSAIINDLGVRQFRFVSYWKNHEAVQGKYDFSELDWQFKMAEESGSKVSLAIGLRQPRWPECHPPEWAEKMTKDEWYPHLKDYITATVNRYKDHPSLVSWQLENEFFMTVFGDCPDHSRERLVDEFELVKSLDDTHPIIISRSNNWIGLPLGEPRPDKFGISIYKRVWDKSFTKRYFEYPLPAWFYAMLAGWGEIFTGNDMIVHELQAEPWAPDGFDFKTMSIEEQNKSMNPERLHGRFDYARGTGMRSIDLWGAEWWYRRKVLYGDPSLWNAAREEFTKYQYPSVYRN